MNHLLYMNDLNLMAATRNQLSQLFKIVEEFSGDIRMQFELDKCRILNIVNGKIQPGAFEMQNCEAIAAMEADQRCK